MRHMQRLEEIGLLAESRPSPNVPTTGATLRRMSHSIKWLEVKSLKRNPQLFRSSGKGRYYPDRATNGQDFRLGHVCLSYSRPNGQRSPAAAPRRRGGRLVQRVLGTVPGWVYHGIEGRSKHADA